MVARSTSCGDYSAVSLPRYLAFQYRIRSGVAVELLRMRYWRERGYIQFAEVML